MSPSRAECNSSRVKDEPSSPEPFHKDRSSSRDANTVSSGSIFFHETDLPAAARPTQASTRDGPPSEPAQLPNWLDALPKEPREARPSSVPHNRSGPARSRPPH